MKLDSLAIRLSRFSHPIRRLRWFTRRGREVTSSSPFQRLLLPSAGGSTHADNTFHITAEYEFPAELRCTAALSADRIQKQR